MSISGWKDCQGAGSLVLMRFRQPAANHIAVYTSRSLKFRSSTPALFGCHHWDGVRTCTVSRTTKSSPSSVILLLLWLPTPLRSLSESSLESRLSLVHNRTCKQTWSQSSKLGCVWWNIPLVYIIRVPSRLRQLLLWFSPPGRSYQRSALPVSLCSGVNDCHAIARWFSPGTNASLLVPRLLWKYMFVPAIYMRV